MSRSSQPGLHDPYWYEALVGLRYVVDLLDPESNLVGVTFQQPSVEGLDDVVAAYSDGRRAGVQVKNTRVEAPLTFNDMVRARDGVSLLRKLTRGWTTLSAGDVQCSTRLFSNRQLADEQTRADAQPALAAFWRALTAAIAEARTLGDVRLPTEYETAWEAWFAELSELDEGAKLQFLQTLRIDGGQPDLAGLEAEVIARLMAVLGNIPRSVADQIYDRLVRRLATWTTSGRGSATEVHAEDVLAAIGVPHEEAVGDHDFPPPAPFFPSRVTFANDLANDLRTAPERVTFLTGPAGCGKTSIVSTLANRTDPVVDLRFYAFRPISPTTATLPQDYSQTATAAALWGDLLMQLRTRHFVGRLNEAAVPARNDLLADDPARLRDHVLRLAARLATERGHPTVIAVDGLDHAARARTLAPEQLRGQPSLLDWLVPPSDIPDGVHFLIAGQPQYDRYPLWLRNRTGVRVVEVPPIATADIEVLLKRDLGTFPPDQVPRAAAIISELSRGNTLAAVYAVAEAQVLPDALALRTRLETRQLHAGIEEYYDRIWNGALAPLQASVPAAGSLLAAALALSSARLTGSLLRGFYPDTAFGVADWEQVLRALAPIIEEQDGTFAVRHNDVRVFLTGRLQSTPGAHATAASSIADFYLRASASPAKYADLMRALSFANRHAELPGVFTAAYVVEAWTVERPMAELVGHARHAVTAVRPETGWETLHHLALGLRTLQQLRSALQWLDEPGPPTPIPACLPSEARPTPRAAWTVAAVQGVLGDATRLADAGEIPRARDLLRRWFADISPVEIVDELRRHPGDLNPVEQRDLDETLHSLVRGWGALAQRVGVPRSSLRASLDGDAGTTMAHFYGGWLTAGVTAARPWEQTLRLPRIRFFRDLEAAVRELARAERWDDVATTLRRATDTRGKFSSRFQIAAAPWALHTGDADVIGAWAQPVAEGGFAAAGEIEHSFDENDIQLYEAIAFTLGWLQPTRPASAISAEGADAYFARRTYETGQATMRRHLYATATVARLERAAAANPLDLGAAVRPEEVAAIVRGFFAEDTDQGHEVTPFATRGGTRLLARVLAIVVAQRDARYTDAVVPTVLARGAERPYDAFLEVLWQAAADRGLHDLLQHWVVRWVGPDGEAWRMDLGDRAEAVRRFAPLARRAGFGDLAAAAEERLRRLQVGYIGRKEYALAVPLEWFETAARDDPSVWEVEGARLMSISRVASEGGDNREAVYVEGAVTTAAARSGPAALWRCLMGLAADLDPPLALARTSAVDGIIGALEGTPASGAELRTLWCIGIGCLVWEYERHRLSLQHLRQALLAVASTRADAALPATLAAIAPRAFEITGNDQLYRYPSRWFGTREPNEPPPPYLRGAEALLGDLRTLSLDDAVAGLEAVAAEILNDHRGSSSDLWRAVADTATRLADTRPANFRSLLSRLVAITRERRDPYPWHFDGIERAFTALIPLMTDPERWALCMSMLDALSMDDAREFWVETAAANLASLCGIRALAGTPEDRRAGLARELGAQETWILGPDRQGRGWPLVTPAAADDATPHTWEAFGVRGLAQLIGGASGAHRVQAALRGLYALCSADPSQLGALTAEWERMPEERRELLLLLAERLVVDIPGVAATALHPLLERTANSGGGRQQLQAAIALYASSRVRNDVPLIDLDARPANHTHPALTAGLIEAGREMYGAIPLTRGTSAVRQTVQQLAVALDVDPTRLERAVAGLVGQLPSSPPNRRKPVDALEGEMLLRPSGALESVAQWAVEEAVAGCFGVVDTPTLAQALLNMDDPWVLTRPAAALSDSASWPVDDELASLLAAGRGDTVGALTEQVRTGIGAGEHVLGAVLHTFTRDTDVVFHLETRWAREIVDLTGLRQPTTFNGRTFAYYNAEAFEPEQRAEAGWLTFRTGGQGLFFHGGVPLTPAAIVWRHFGWKPRANDPFTWEGRDGHAVARFEIVHGPVRGAAQDRLYRQPTLCRWIISQQAWQDAERAMAATFRTMPDLTTYSVR